jgi:phage terminase small subunit
MAVKHEVLKAKIKSVRLSNKQKMFIEEYLISFNATQAAIDAGYSEKSAATIGSENIRKPHISKAIKKRLSERAMSADEVLDRLANMARGDMGDFMDIGSISISLDLNKAKDLGLTHLIKKVKDRSVMTIDKDGIETETHTLEVELHDAQSALVHLGRHHKIFVDRMEHSGSDINIKVGIDARKL